MTVTLRPMRWWDLPAVVALEQDVFVEDAWSEAMFWSELAEHASRHYVVATADDGSLVGYAGACVYAPDQAFVQTIAVAPDRRGEGTGRLLLEALLAAAEARGAQRVDLEVRADNVVAQRLYQRHGFRGIGVRRGYYQPSGADALVMRREVS